MLQPLEEMEKEIAFSEGFLENWLQTGNAPPQVLEHLQKLSNGVKFYRDKFVSAQEDAVDQRTKYNTLTAQTAQYLQHIQQQKEQIDQLLIEQQREFHKEEPTSMAILYDKT